MGWRRRHGQLRGQEIVRVKVLVVLHSALGVF